MMTSRKMPRMTPMVLLVLGALLQWQLGLNSDAAYLIQLSDIMRTGGQYGVDFFETNPPMILYLSSLPSLAAHFFSANIHATFLGFVLILVMYSYYASWHLLKGIVTDQPTLTVLLLIQLIVLIFLPLNQFGQREHLFLILSLPYYYLVVSRLSSVKVSFLIALMIGLFAGVGFAIKPYFLIPLILTELWVIRNKGGLSAEMRIEVVSILCVLLAYAIAVVLFHQTYFTILFPLIKQFYFPGVYESWQQIFTQTQVLFCLSGLISYGFLIRHTRYPVLLTVLTIGLLGTMLSFLVTHTSWYYHTYPAQALTCLIYALMIGEWIFKPTLIGIIKTILIGMLIFAIPLETSYLTYRFYNDENIRAVKAELKKYLDTAKGARSVMCFSANTTADCFPLVMETQSVYASRFPFFWWLRGMMRAGQESQNKAFLIGAVANDLNRYQPHWVIINTQSEGVIFGRQFDYIRYFSKNRLFKAAWQPYRYVKSVDFYQIYQRSPL